MIGEIRKIGVGKGHMYINRPNRLECNRIRTGIGLYLKRLGRTDAMDRVAEYDIYRLMKGVKKAAEQEKIVKRLENSISESQAASLLLSGKVTCKAAQTSLAMKITSENNALNLLNFTSLSNISSLEGKEFPAFCSLSQNIGIDTLDELVRKQSPNRYFIRRCAKNAVNRLELADCAKAVKIGIYAYEYPAWDQFENEVMKPAVTFLSQLSNSKNYAGTQQIVDILVMLVNYPSNAALKAAHIYFKDVDSVDGAKRMLHVLNEYAKRCPSPEDAGRHDDVQYYLAGRVLEIAKNAKSKELLDFALAVDGALTSTISLSARNRLDGARQYLHNKAQAVFDAAKD